MQPYINFAAISFYQAIIPQESTQLLPTPKILRENTALAFFYFLFWEKWQCVSHDQPDRLNKSIETRTACTINAAAFCLFFGCFGICYKVHEGL